MASPVVSRCSKSEMPSQQIEEKGRYNFGAVLGFSKTISWAMALTPA